MRMERKRACICFPLHLKTQLLSRPDRDWSLHCADKHFRAVCLWSPRSENRYGHVADWRRGRVPNHHEREEILNGVGLDNFDTGQLKNEPVLLETDDLEFGDIVASA